MVHLSLPNRLPMARILASVGLVSRLPECFHLEAFGGIPKPANFLTGNRNSTRSARSIIPILGIVLTVPFKIQDNVSVIDRRKKSRNIVQYTRITLY